jgi:hypothetical protein
MKLENMYIISWFGSDPVLADRRRDMHRAQLQWSRQHGLQPVVFAQQYRPEDYEDGVTYIVNDGPVLHPGPARNRLLEHFYLTDADYAVFADNDGVLYEGPQHGDSARYVELMRELPIDEFEHIDIIDPINPQRVAFTEELANDIYRTHLLYRRTNRIKGTLFFMKNIMRHRGMRHWFDEQLFNDNGRMRPGEDTEFAVAALFKGLGCYTTHCAIVKELGTGHSTWTSSNEHANIVPIYRAINAKYGRDIYRIPEEIIKTFSAVGHSIAPDGTRAFHIATDADSRRRSLSRDHTDIVLYETTAMPVQQLLEWAEAHIDDAVLKEWLAEQRRKKRKFVNLSKNKVRFDWEQIPMFIPGPPNKISVRKPQHMLDAAP